MLWRMPTEPRTARIGSMFIHFQDSTGLLRRERRRCNPLVEIAQRPRAECLLALLAAKGPVDRREQAEIDVHRLEGGGIGAAGDVAQQSAHGRRRGWRDGYKTPPLGGGELAGHESDGSAFDIAFAAGDLAGEAQARHRLQAQGRIEQTRTVEKRVAVQPAQPRELGLLQAGDCAEEPRLLAVLELGLEAHDVPQGAERVVLAELHDGPWTMAGARIAQANGLHRSEAQGLRSARRDHLDRLAAVEIGRVVLPLLELGLVAGQESRDEGVVLVLVERAVEIIRAVAGRAALV